MPQQRRHALGWIAAIAALLVVVFIVPWGSLFGPERSVASYCRVWQEEGTKLRDRQIAARRQGENGDIFAPITAAMAGPGDLAALFDKLDKVAPDEIEPDVKRYRDAMQELADSLKEGNLLNMLTKQMEIAAQTKGVEDRINAWTQTNCTTSTTK